MGGRGVGGILKTAGALIGMAWDCRGWSGVEEVSAVVVVVGAVNVLLEVFVWEGVMSDGVRGVCQTVCRVSIVTSK